MHFRPERVKMEEEQLLLGVRGSESELLDNKKTGVRKSGSTKSPLCCELDMSELKPGATFLWGPRLVS